MEIAHCELKNNVACKYGGAIKSFYGHLSLTDCILSENSVESRYYGGGAIYNYDAIFTVRDCAFLHNASNSDGGAIYDGSFNTRVNISNTRFCDNVAKRGGAIASSSYKSTMLIDNAVFSSNMAEDHCGAIANCSLSDESTISLSDCSFKDNWPNDHNI